VGLIDRLSHTDPGIKPVVNLDRADLDAVSATGAGNHINRARVFVNSDPEVPGSAFNFFHLGQGMDPDVFVSLDIHHLGREDAHGAVVGGKRLVELRHMAANRRLPLYQVDDNAMVCEVERSLDAGNPGPDDDNITHVHIPRRA
jgi:hypothetical protein